MSKIKWSAVPEEQINPKMKRKMIYGSEIMVAKMEFEAGFEVPWHAHSNEQITEVIEGVIRLWFDYNETDYIQLEPGESLIIAGNRPHKALMVTKVSEIDIFSPPRQDWIQGTDAYLRK